MMIFSRHCLGVSFWFRTAFFISRIAECKELPPYFKVSAVRASSEPNDLVFFYRFYCSYEFFFCEVDIFIFRSCGASAMFDVSTRSLELFNSSSKYFPIFLLTHLYLLEDFRFFYSPLLHCLWLILLICLL